MLTRSLRSVSMSRTWGMFSRMISSSVRMAAAMQGRAEFFAPETLMVPRRGLPPRTTNLSIESVYGDFAWKWVAGRVRVGQFARASLFEREKVRKVTPALAVANLKYND